MRIRNMIKEICNPNFSLTERLFRLIMLIGLAALLIGIIVGILAGEKIENTGALLVAFLVF